MRYPFIKECERQFSISALCRVMKVARSGYYAWCQRVPSKTETANLKLTDDEVRKFQADLDDILAHVDRLKEIDTSQVEPMAQVLYDAEETVTLRPDRERPALGNQLALANAPLAGGGYFKVPEVIKR